MKLKLNILCLKSILEKLNIYAGPRNMMLQINLNLFKTCRTLSFEHKRELFLANTKKGNKNGHIWHSICFIGNETKLLNEALFGDLVTNGT
jgi:hypothetical protein